MINSEERHAIQTDKGSMALQRGPGLTKQAVNPPLHIYASCVVL